MYHANVPLPANRSRMIAGSPIYFGWIIVAAATVGLIMSSPGQTYAISIFIEHFIADLGISRGAVSTLYAVGTLVGSAALPLIGRRIDLHGPRIMVVIIAAAFGLACLLMASVRTGWMLLIGFVLVRMLGQGGMSLVSNYTINQWWIRRRGTVVGISGVLLAVVGVGGFPNFISWLIPLVGWRMTYAILGGMLLLGMTTIGYLFYRSRPEQFGLLPDGRRLMSAGRDAGATGTAAGTDDEVNWTAHEALRTRAFWIVVLGTSTVGMLSTGLTFHMVGIFADNGLTASAAAAVFLPIGFVSAAVNLLSGMLVDRMPVRFLLVGALLLQALALFMAQVLTGTEMALAYGVVLGMLYGMMRIASAVIWPTYFGRLHLGSIAGIAGTVGVAGSALGPLPMGVARDLLGSYNLTLSVLAVLPLVLAVLTLFLRRPTKPA